MPGTAADLELDVENAALQRAGGRTILVGNNRTGLRYPADRQQAEKPNGTAESYSSQRSPQFSLAIMAG